MTIQEAINREDKLKANQIDIEDKIRWLTRLDRQIYEEVILQHDMGEDYEAPDFDKYNLLTELIVPDVYANVYLKYLELQIAITNNEPKAYNSATTNYNNAYITVQDFYNRNYMPKQRGHFDYRRKR